MATVKSSNEGGEAPPLRVSVESLRMVAVDRIPGAVQVCADNLGIEPGELIAMAERGELTAEHLAPVMTEELREILSLSTEEPSAGV